MKVAVVAALLVSTQVAFAEDEIGRIPVLEVAAVGGFSSAGPMTPTGVGSLNGIVGVQGRLTIDAGPALVYGEGTWNMLDGGIATIARGGVIFGWRGLANVFVPQGQTVVGGQVVDVTKVYFHKKLPFVYGPMLGVSHVRQGAMEFGYSNPVHQDATQFMTLEAGAAIKGGQFEAMFAPLTYEPSSGSRGMRWSAGLAFPIGSHPFWFSFSGDHIFRDDGDSNIGTTILFSLGSGSSYGVTAR